MVILRESFIRKYIPSTQQPYEIPMENILSKFMSKFLFYTIHGEYYDCIIIILRCTCKTQREIYYLFIIHHGEHLDSIIIKLCCACNTQR